MPTKGWLRTQAQTNSLLELARRLKKQTKDSRKAKSIAVALGDVDQGDVSWLLDGSGRVLLSALADLLDLEESELVRLAEHAGGRRADGPAIYRWPFAVFAALRPLNLSNEPLMPGFPRPIAQGAHGGGVHTRLWWAAPAGAGKTLAGRWLERHGWRYQQAATWADIDWTICDQLYIELGSAADADLDALLEDRPHTWIWIASADWPLEHLFPTEDNRETNDDPEALRRAYEIGLKGFTPVGTPPAEEWSWALVDWMAQRLDDDAGGFDPESLKRALREDGWTNLFSTPGELIEFAGAVDEVGFDQMESDLAPLIRRWLQASLARTDREQPSGVARLLSERAVEVLFELERARLLAGRADDAPTLTEWAEWVPTQVAPPPNVGELLELVDQPGEVPHRKLKAIRKRLQPDGPAVVQGLVLVGLLQRVGADGFELRPSWVLAAMRSAAIQALLKAGPKEAGAVLCQPSLAEAGMEVLQALLIEEPAGWALLEPWLTANPGAGPEIAMALAAAVTAVGFALGLGARVPADLVDALWHRIPDLLHTAYTQETPRPLLLPWTGPGDHQAEDRWQMAALCLSLDRHRRGLSDPPGPLAPWGAQDAAALPEAALSIYRGLPVRNAYVHHVGGRRRREWTQAEIDLSFRLGSELWDALGAVVQRGGHRLAAVQVPAATVAQVLGTWAPEAPAALSQFTELRTGWRQLRLEADRREVTDEQIAAWWWTLCLKDKLSPPSLAWREDPEGEAWLALLWRHIPMDSLNEAHLGEIRRGLEQRNPAWGRRWWPKVLWFRLLDTEPQRIDRDVVRDAPVDVLVEIARKPERLAQWHPAVEAAWAKAPQVMLQQLDAASHDPARNTVLRHLVFGTPDEHRAAVLERATGWLGAPTQYPGDQDWLRPWLARMIVNRKPHWRHAFALLHTDANRADTGLHG